MTVSRLLFLSANADEWYSKRIKSESQDWEKRNKAAVNHNAVDGERHRSAWLRFSFAPAVCGSPVFGEEL